MIFAAVLTSGVSSLKFPSFMAPTHQRELNGNNRQPTIRDESGFIVRALIPPFKVIGAAALSLTLITPPVMAESSQVIGSIAGSGLVFKDTLTIESFKDPKIPAVSLYISNFQKPLTERLASGKDFFTDPSYASVGCAKTVKGKIR